MLLESYKFNVTLCINITKANPWEILTSNINSK